MEQHNYVGLTYHDQLLSITVKTVDLVLHDLVNFAPLAEFGLMVWNTKDDFEIHLR